MTVHTLRLKPSEQRLWRAVAIVGPYCCFGLANISNVETMRSDTHHRPQRWG